MTATATGHMMKAGESAAAPGVNVALDIGGIRAVRYEETSDPTAPSGERISPRDCAYEEEPGLVQNRTEEQKPRSGYRYRSPFWVIVAMAIGAAWLLFNRGIIPPESLGVLFYIWPVFLVGIGVDLLAGWRTPVLGALVGIGTIGLIAGIMLAGLQLGWAGDIGLKTQVINTSVDQATGARVALGVGDYSVEVHALSPSTVSSRSLLKADMEYRGDLHFESSGDSLRSVVLETRHQSWWWRFLSSTRSVQWHIGLDPMLPLSLNVESGIGPNILDLRELRLTDVSVTMNSGSGRLFLPSNEGRSYEAGIHLISGNMEAEVVRGAHLNMAVKVSSGNCSINVGDDSDVMISFECFSGDFSLGVPAGCPLRVEAGSVSSGDIQLPQDLVAVLQDHNGEGIWETRDFVEARHRVFLKVERMGSGSMRIILGGQQAR